MKITRTTTFSDTAAATVKLAQASAAGTETEASRSDHVHGGPSLLVTPAAVTINNDSTLTADGTLIFAAVANTNYFAEWWVGVASNSDTGFKVSVTVPTSATISMFVGSSTDNGSKPYGNANNTGSAVDTDVAGRTPRPCTCGRTLRTRPTRATSRCYGHSERHKLRIQQ